MSIEKELLQDTPLVLLNFYKLVSFCHYAGIVLGTEERNLRYMGMYLWGRLFKIPILRILPCQDH